MMLETRQMASSPYPPPPAKSMQEEGGHIRWFFKNYLMRPLLKKGEGKGEEVNKNIIFKLMEIRRDI
jgi:hypothetical protein